MVAASFNTMNRTLLLLAAAAVTAAVAATASASPRAHAAQSSTVKLSSTNVGRILETSRGAVVYMFSKDRHGTDTCVKISGCTGVWPPLWVSGRPTGGPGVNTSLLGTVAVGRHRQVTYAGHPLYTYVGAGPGDTSYVGAPGFNGTWYAVTASGKARS